MDTKQWARELRKTGHSMPEISRRTGLSRGTTWRCVHDVVVLPEFLDVLSSKRWTSTQKAQERWAVAELRAKYLLSDHVEQGFITVLACLYWAEGSKKEFTFTNTDPDMIGVVVGCLERLSVPKDRLKVTVRIFEDMVARKAEISRYWANIIGINPDDISNIVVLSGKKEGKLRYGMCRIRISKGGEYYKIIQSAISEIRRMNFSKLP